jgi:predicted cobalt transporter CbtA
MGKAMNKAKQVWVAVLAAVLAILSHPAGARACSACYGEPDSPASRGLTLAISALAVVVMAVLGGVVAFFVQASRKAELLEASVPASALIEKS